MKENIKEVHWVMDIETMINCFIACFERADTGEQHEFIINQDRNDFHKLMDFLTINFKNQEFHVSYNGIEFDAQVLQWMMKTRGILGVFDSDTLTSKISLYAQSLINAKNSGAWLPYAPWELFIKQIDLFKLNHWDNPAKMSTLKWIQYSMDWDNVEEMPIHYTTLVETEKDLNLVLSYCWNDVKSTKEIYNYSLSQIELRKTLSEEYQLDLRSASEPGLAKGIFGKILSEKLGVRIQDLKKMRTPRDKINIADVILPYIKFTTPEFNTLLNYMKSKIISGTKGELGFTVKYKGVNSDYGSGGMHGARTKGVYEAKDGFTIMTSDVRSFYTNLAIRNKWSPAHLPANEFCELYEWLYDERVKIPKSNPLNYVYKILLNSTYGLSNEPNSFLYDPLLTMQITINGQLSLSMLYEMICERIPNCYPLMQNTDGFEIMIPNEYKQLYAETCKEWEDLTKLELEHDEYSKMIIGDVNNYIAIHEDGRVKAKGRFEWEEQDKKSVAYFHKNKSFLVIPKAIYEYFVNGVRPPDYIKTNTNIFDFCGAKKGHGDWGYEEIYLQDNEIKVNALQKLVRYFMSKDGHKLMKVNKVDRRRSQVEAGNWMSIVCNDMSDIPDFKDCNIDYNYYLKKIYAEIDGINKDTYRDTKQLQLL